jgi:hypothetical protein
MFNQNQNHNGYHFQQNWMDHVNMGNPYYSVSPYPNYPAPNSNPTQYYQPPIQTNYQPHNNGWNYQPVYQVPNSATVNWGKSNVQSIFKNPLEPENPYNQQVNLNQYQMNYNPYPKMNTVPRPNGGLGTIMNSFKGQDGNIDINKMMNTAGQMMNAVSQVSAMVKGLGGMFKV